MDMKRHLKSALKQIGFDKPRKAQIIPMNTLDAEQDAIIIAATGSGKQVIYETVGLAHSDKLTIVIEPLLALIYNQVQTLQAHCIPADYIDTVSYTHLDVYKRQMRNRSSSGEVPPIIKLAHNSSRIAPPRSALTADSTEWVQTSRTGFISCSSFETE